MNTPTTVRCPMCGHPTDAGHDASYRCRPCAALTTARRNARYAAQSLTLTVAFIAAGIAVWLAGWLPAWLEVWGNWGWLATGAVAAVLACDLLGCTARLVAQIVIVRDLRTLQRCRWAAVADGEVTQP